MEAVSQSSSSKAAPKQCTGSNSRALHSHSERSQAQEYYMQSHPLSHTPCEPALGCVSDAVVLRHMWRFTLL